MKKVIWILAIVLVLCVFGGRAWYLHQRTAEENQDNKPVVKIGVILPLTSMAAKVGQEMLESIKIAEQDINNDPQYNFKVKMLIEDGKMQSKASVDAFQKLIAQKVDTMIVFAEISVKSVSRFVQDNKIPTLAIDGRPYSGYLFTVPVSNKTLGYTYGKYVAEKMNLKRIGVIHLDDLMGKETTEAFIKGAKEKGCEITAIEKYKGDTIDTKAQVLKLLDKDPDAIFTYGYGDRAFPATINYIRTLGYNKPILSLFVLSEAIPFLRDKHNLYFSDLSFQNQYDTYDFLGEYYKKFPDAYPNFTVVSHYIAAHMIAKVANKVGTKDPDLFMKELKSLSSFDTPYGPMQIIGGETYLPMFAKKVLPDGTIEIVEEIK